MIGIKIVFFCEKSKKFDKYWPIFWLFWKHQKWIAHGWYKIRFFVKNRFYFSYFADFSQNIPLFEKRIVFRHGHHHASMFGKVIFFHSFSTSEKVRNQFLCAWTSEQPIRLGIRSFQGPTVVLVSTGGDKATN